MKPPMSIDHMLAIAHREGRQIEISGHQAFLKIGRITYVAELDAFYPEPLTDGFHS